MYLIASRYIIKRVIHFFNQKTNSKNISLNAQAKSHEDGLVDEMERERETFSAVASVTHCLRSGTVGGGDGPVVRGDAYRDR